MQNARTSEEIPVAGNSRLLFRREVTALHNRIPFVHAVTIALLVLWGCIPSVLHAQTEWKDRSVTLAKEDQSVPSIARPTQVGSTIVVWEDARDLVNGPDIYIQKMDDQTGLPMWIEPDGLPVCTAGGPQRNPVAAYDSLGGVIIAWEDYRNGYAAVYAVRLDAATGAVDPAWPVNGVAVCDVQAACEHIRIAGTADGAFITWLDSRNAVGGANRLVYAQYMLSATASWPTGLGMSWTQNGILVSVNPGGDQANPEIERDYIWRPDANAVVKSGCVIAYQNEVFHGGQPYWNAYATNLDANGNQRYGGADVALAPMPSEQLYPRIVCAGEEVTADRPRAIVVWQDSREDPIQPRYDIIAQVIDAAGTVQNSMGEIICDIPETQRHPVPVLWERPYDPNTGAPYIPFVTIAWEDFRDFQVTASDIYAGQLDARSLVITNPSGPAGEMITQAGTVQDQVAMDMIPNSSIAYIAWRHAKVNPNETDIHYQEVDVRWWQYGRPLGGWPVTEAKDDQQLPQVAGAVLVWEDNRRQPIHNDIRYDRDISCQTPGECVGPTAMDWRDIHADVRQEGDAAHHRFTTDADFNTYIVWEKRTGDPTRQDVYVQKIDATGVPRWTNGGIKLNTVDYAQHPEVAISDVGGGAQVVWQQTDPGTGTEEMWYAKIDPEGNFDIVPEMLRTNATHPMIVYSDYIVDPAGSAGSPPITSEYSAYFGCTVGGDLDIGVRKTRILPPDFWSVTNTQYPGNWEHIEKMVSPPGQHLYLVGTGDDPAFGKKYCIVQGRLRYTNPQKLDFGIKAFGAWVDFGGIDIALDERVTGNTHDAIVVVALSNYPQWGAWLYAHWASAFYTSIGSADVLIGAPQGNSRFSHPRLSPDDLRGQNTYGGMLLAWDYEFPTASGQRHMVVTDKITYATGSYPPWISRCDPFLPPIMVTNQQYTWPTNPDIARINAPNGVDTLAFVAWEGITESCAPVRPREIVGQWVAYNYFPGPQRGPQWPAEKQLSPGPGMYTQSSPLVQTSDANTIQVYWFDGRSGVDLVMGTRLWGAPNNVIEWAKDREQQAAALPNGPALGETYPNPLSLTSGSVSHIVIEVEVDQTVDLTLHDMLGRVVGVLHQGLLTAGRHVLRFDPSGLRPGSYFYTLRAPGDIATRGLVIVR